MWAVYQISRSTGRIRWQPGGRKSDFDFGPQADFYWQHDAHYCPGNRISMFDYGCCSQPDGTPEQQSHGLILDLDFRNHQATTAGTFYHQSPLFAASQGNTQALPGGNEFVGWGLESYYSEYAGAGNTEGNGLRNLLYDAKMPGTDISYRAFRNSWVGNPTYPPNAAVRSKGPYFQVKALDAAGKVLGVSDVVRVGHR